MLLGYKRKKLANQRQNGVKKSYLDVLNMAEELAQNKKNFLAWSSLLL